MIPQHSFGKNLHHILSKEDWDTVRKYIYKKDGYACSICKKKNTRLSAHEEWDFKITNTEKKTGTQKLVTIWALCDDCHMIKHIAFASELAHQGKLDLNNLIIHFLNVNECEKEDFVEHYNEAVDKWNELYDYKFRLSLHYLKSLPIELSTNKKEVT
jgi:hypothetical protein